LRYIYTHTEIRRIAAGHTHVIHAVSDTEGSEVEAQVTVGEHGPDQKGNEMGAPIRIPIKTGWTVEVENKSRPTPKGAGERIRHTSFLFLPSISAVPCNLVARIVNLRRLSPVNRDGSRSDTRRRPEGNGHEPPFSGSCVYSGGWEVARRAFRAFLSIGSEMSPYRKPGQEHENWVYKRL